MQVENHEHAAVVRSGAGADGSINLATSLGLPSMEPEVWRKDVRRAKDRLGRGQMLVVSVVGTPVPGGDLDALALDYARCAEWAAAAGAGAVEVHLASPGPDRGQILYEDPRAAAYVLARVRRVVSRPVIAKLGGFRSPRLLHETMTALAPWAHGFTLVDGILRQVVDAEGHPAFEGAGRAVASVVGPDTYAVCARQVEETLAWRRAGQWDRAILAAGGVTSVDRALKSLRDGADAVLVGPAVIADPLLAYRFRSAVRTAA